MLQNKILELNGPQRYVCNLLSPRQKGDHGVSCLAQGQRKSHRTQSQTLHPLKCDPPKGFHTSLTTLLPPKPQSLQRLSHASGFVTVFFLLPLSISFVHPTIRFLKVVLDFIFPCILQHRATNMQVSIPQIPAEASRITKNFLPYYLGECYWQQLEKDASLKSNEFSE